MLGVAALVALFGYSVLYYGLDQISGGNNGFWSLVIPGKFTNQPKDTPGKDWSANPVNPNTAPGFGNVPATPTAPGTNIAPTLPPVTPIPPPLVH